MKTPPLFAILTLAALGASPFGACAQAATITFSDPKILSGERDIITAGTFDRAVSFGGSDQTVGGVKFEAGNIGAGTSIVDIDTITLASSADNVVNMGGSHTFVGAGGAFEGFSTGYKSLLGSGAYASTTSGTLTLTLHDLKKGTAYLVQFFVNDSRDFHGGTRHETVRSGDAISQVLNFSSTGRAGGVGEFVTATFTADDLKQDFEFTPVDTAGDDAQINAFQLRVVPSAAVSTAVPTRPGR